MALGVDLSFLRKLFLWTVVAALCGTAVVAIIALAGGFDDTDARIVSTTAAIAFFSLLSLPAGVLLDQGRFGPLTWAVFGLSTIGLLLVLDLIWVEWDDPSDFAWKSAVVVTSFAAALSQTAATQSRRTPQDPALVTRLIQFSAGSGLTLASLVSLAVLFEIEDDGIYRLLGAVAIVNVLAALLQPILRRTAAPATEGGLRILCIVERPPERLPRRGYRAREGSPTEIECELRAGDFASAAGRAIRELERAGARVVRVERL